MTPEEKRPGYRYIIYRFPTNTNMSTNEKETIRLLLKQDLRWCDRRKVIDTLRRVYRRDEQKRSELEGANAILGLNPSNHP